MARQRVQNINHAIEVFPPKQYRNWLEYWRDQIGDHSLPNRCRCCHNFYQPQDIVAGYVEKIDQNGTVIGRQKYLIPLCYHCNSPENQKPFNVELDELVPMP